MDSKKIKLALLRMKIKDNKSSLNSERSINISKNLINRNFNLSKGNISTNSNNSLNKISNNLLSIYSQRKHHIPLSPEKALNLSEDFFPISNNKNMSIDLLKENLIKTKEMYNEQNHELYKLKLRYNKLYKFHEESLKILQSLINRSGINTNISNLTNEEIVNTTNNCDFSHAITAEEKENLKEKYLIFCYKTKILEYQYLLDKKNEEISKIKKSSRICRLSKLESDNACKSLENINLSKEKQILNEKIINMENVMGSLNNRCQLLEKNENKNMNNIEELQSKIKNLLNEIDIKDKIIEKLNKKINKNKEESRLAEKKIFNLEIKINGFNEEKKIYQKYLDEKTKYESNDEKMKKKCELLKNENDKLTQNYNQIKKEYNEYFIKYDTIRKEKEKYLLNKEENKIKIKDKEKQIKLINDQIINKENKNGELRKKIENFEKNNNYDNLENINEVYKEIFKNNIEEIELLKQKMQKIEEKVGILNKNAF